MIRPFRNKVTAIAKESNFGNSEYIAIELEANLGCLPDFEKGTMYKNMEIDKRYTLEELKL